jgi:hypothetical protein
MGQWMVKRGDCFAAQEMFAHAIRLYSCDVSTFGHWMAMTFFPMPFLNWLIAVQRRCQRLMLCKSCWWGYLD